MIAFYYTDQKKINFFKKSIDKWIDMMYNKDS